MRRSVNWDIRGPESCGVEVAFGSDQGSLSGALLSGPTLLLKDAAVVHTCISNVTANKLIHEWKEVESWDLAARWLDRLVVGGGKTLFEKRLDEVYANPGKLPLL